MELTKQSISNHSRLIPGIEGYLTLIDKIEENKSIHPDIAIETCKSLLEGLCLKGLSLLSDKYINSKSLRTKCKNDLKILTNTAFDEVYTDYVESQVHESLANMLIDISVTQKIKDNAKRKVREQAIEAVAKVSAIRNERGDISHGRDYPKTQESSITLSKSISSITDGICSFMIEQIAEKYLLKLKTQDRLIYQDLTDFNDWLDEMHHVSTIKVDFSKILYENAYDKYEEYYYTEYIDLVETEEEATKEISDTLEEEAKEVIAEAIEAETSIEQPVPEKTEKSTEKKVEKLVTDFDEETFWTEDKIQALQEFAEAENLKVEELKVVVNEYLFSEKPPLRDDVAKTMLERPKLSELKTVVPSLTEKIMAFANDLKNPEAEA
ncbi:type I restriction endonuclease subunit R, EcoR124 family [Algoriphagus hitonicola]|uniref:Type I restriction enzyme R protein C-terminal domain-containing protein n=1 Tax=Algoriphagus hitonicola TaxID=435880 RepID=A0A1I2X843_9BACT|nr:hypothetical protein [Algoriphagus hitonicola]SFH09704.1 hypothetical protein SAMN04487988_1176 [Algoriphagus hitonicola]